MECLGQLVIRSIYQVTVDVFRKNIVRNIDDNDINLGKIKVLLESEFETVTKKLDKLLESPLLQAQQRVKAGIIALENNQLDIAYKSFINAEEFSQIAFWQLSGLQHKTEAAKLRMYAALHTSDYFQGSFSTVDNKNYLYARLKQIKTDINGCTEIKSIKTSKSVFQVRGVVIPPGLRDMKSFEEILLSKMEIIQKMSIHVILKAPPYPPPADAVPIITADMPIIRASATPIPLVQAELVSTLSGKYESTSLSSTATTIASSDISIKKQPSLKESSSLSVGYIIIVIIVLFIGVVLGVVLGRK